MLKAKALREEPQTLLFIETVLVVMNFPQITDFQVIILKRDVISSLSKKLILTSDEPVRTQLVRTVCIREFWKRWRPHSTNLSGQVHLELIPLKNPTWRQNISKSPALCPYSTITEATEITVNGKLPSLVLKFCSIKPIIQQNCYIYSLRASINCSYAIFPCIQLRKNK